MILIIVFKMINFNQYNIEKIKSALFHVKRKNRAVTYSFCFTVAYK